MEELKKKLSAFVLSRKTIALSSSEEDECDPPNTDCGFGGASPNDSSEDEGLVAPINFDGTTPSKPPRPEPLIIQKKSLENIFKRPMTCPGETSPYSNTTFETRRQPFAHPVRSSQHVQPKSNEHRSRFSHRRSMPPDDNRNPLQESPSRADMRSDYQKAASASPDSFTRPKKQYPDLSPRGIRSAIHPKTSPGGTLYHKKAPFRTNRGSHHDAKDLSMLPPSDARLAATEPYPDRHRDARNYNKYGNGVDGTVDVSDGDDNVSAT